MQRLQTVASIILVTLSAASCSGGDLFPASSSATVPAGAAAPQPETAAAPAMLASAAGNDSAAIRMLHVFGAPLREIADQSEAPESGGTGACVRGTRRFVPDRNGDADSSEVEIYYDRSCKQLARDAVRVYKPLTPSSESVALTVNAFAPHGVPLSTRIGTISFSNATFGKNGFAIGADGYLRTSYDTLTAAGDRRAVLSDGEFVLAPIAGGSGDFCSDSAAYNAVGIPSLGETFGSQGGFLSVATRTVNADGSVTWTGTHDATVEEAPIGQLSIAVGTPSSVCPIVNPAYTLAGGTVKNASSAAVTATANDGLVLGLSVTRVSERGGELALNASSHPHVWPMNPRFITGTIVSGTAPVASFSIDALGDGSLKIAKTGTTYPVIDWTVVR